MMKAKDIMQKLYDWTPTEHPCGSDKLIFGDENKEIWSTYATIL